MGRVYDFKKAKEIIMSRCDEIETASLGMNDDWGWTANIIYLDGRFSVDIDSVENIAGINGSYWATPTLEIELKNGIPCFIEDAE